MKKETKKIIFGIMLSGLICGSIGISAATYFTADQIKFIPIDESWNATNAEEAINSIHLNQNKTISNLNDELSKVANVYYLGTGTSFDIKTMYSDIDYSNLTSTNFIVGVSSSYFEGTQSSTNGSVSVGSASGSKTLTPSVNYSPSTGILTIANTSGSFSEGLTSTSQSITTFAYLVIGKIN